MLSATLRKTKKNLLNFDSLSYNNKARVYKTKDGRFLSYNEALKHKWKCEKCPETFASFKLLKAHRIQIHSY